MRKPLFILVTGTLAACGSYRVSGTPDSSEDTTPADTASDTAVDQQPDLGEECPPIPGGCVDFCADADGGYAVGIGVRIERCEIAYDERGCPYLDWTTEDCSPGTCDGSGWEPICIDPYTCESMECTCPAGARCSCGLASCSVACEGHCIVSVSGASGVVDCADGAACEVECSGASCVTNCASGGTCAQVCDGTSCTVACDTAASCSQDCNSVFCTVDCQAAGSCSQDCTDSTGSCTCTGC